MEIGLGLIYLVLFLFRKQFISKGKGILLWNCMASIPFVLTLWELYIGDYCSSAIFAFVFILNIDTLIFFIKKEKRKKMLEDMICELKKKKEELEQDTTTK